MEVLTLPSIPDTLSVGTGLPIERKRGEGITHTVSVPTVPS